jgi:hypothetical protein
MGGYDSIIKSVAHKNLYNIQKILDKHAIIVINM